MFCEQCGAELEQDARFCARCGKQVGDESTHPPGRHVVGIIPTIGRAGLPKFKWLILVPIVALILVGALSWLFRSETVDVLDAVNGTSQLNRSDLSREKAEAAIRKRLEPALSALREGTMSMKLSVKGTTFDPERDINQASVALNRNLERFEGVHVDLPRRLKEEVITIGYAGKRAADSLGGVPSSYRYYYRISRGSRCGEGCVNQEGVFIDANRQLLSVTGIRVVGETSRIAEFEYKLVPPAWAAGAESTHNGEARFALYDDGWHLEKINYYK